MTEPRTTSLETRASAFSPTGAGDIVLTVLSGASLEASDARSQAFAALAASLAEDAADWMLYAP